MGRKSRAVSAHAPSFQEGSSFSTVICGRFIFHQRGDAWMHLWLQNAANACAILRIWQVCHALYKHLYLFLLGEMLIPTWTLACVNLSV